MKGLIYASGPMTGKKNFNHEEFNLNAAYLREDGWDVFSPAEMDLELGIDLSGPITEEQYQTLMRNDYRALTQCNAIAFLPGWEWSRGAKLESDFANVLKLDRYRVDASKDYFEKEFSLGITGYARSGKDTISQEFVQNQGFERHGFADSLKAILYALNPRIELFNNDFIGYWHIQSIVDQRGWDEAKKEPEVRQLLQRLGTEGGRQALGTDIWVKTLFSQPTGARVVIPDVRFENERDAIWQRGGRVIRLNRHGVGPVNDHASDKIDFEVDFEVDNNGTPKETYSKIVDYLASVGVEL